MDDLCMLEFLAREEIETRAITGLSAISFAALSQRSRTAEDHWRAAARVRLLGCCPSACDVLTAVELGVAGDADRAAQLGGWLPVDPHEIEASAHVPVGAPRPKPSAGPQASTSLQESGGGLVALLPSVHERRWATSTFGGPTVAEVSPARTIGSLLVGVGRKGAEGGDALNDLLRERLGETGLVDTLGIDVAACRVLHSRERLPFLLKPRDPHKSSFIVKADDDVLVDCAVMHLCRGLNAAFERHSVRLGQAVATVVTYDVTAVEALSRSEDGERRPKDHRFVALVEALPASSVADVRAGLVDTATEPEQTVAKQLKKSGVAGLKAIAGSSMADMRLAECLSHAANSDRWRIKFIANLVGGCVASALFALKDRHNANVLCDPETGLWANVDFSFCFGRAPGGKMSLEKADFRIPDAVCCGVFDGVKVVTSEAKAARKALKKGASVAELLAQATSPAQVLAAKVVAAFVAVRDSFHDCVVPCVCSMPPAWLDALSSATGHSAVSTRDAAKTVVGFIWERANLPDDEFLDLLEDAAGNKGGARYDAFQRQSNGIM